ncbi:DNA-binding NarL/FixJ family response regulator [Nocardioides sp. J9]|uniref:LuxR family transcriptional regulator n=2 Tax=unclassified Nocardioides TaxID=2615069 RepID=UPI00119ECC4E|nr:LuxR family transcriptional regulator [Nocardioides sp. J9]TWG96368.1 DNA-binding NarL/FixJ family response regulator [Nocardioides sp. J9]
MLTEATWWLGRISEYLDLCEVLHRRYLDEGRVDRAAARALDVGVTWLMRGEPALGSGWLSRGRRLLEGVPPGHWHGVLLWADGWQALEAGRVDDATQQGEQLERLGRDLADDTLVALGLVLQGVVRLWDGRLREGFAVLDEAMLPVLADRVEREFTGNIYCTMISACHDLMDLDRAREWTRVTERWVEGFSDAVMFLGVCRAHRLQLHVLEGAWPDVEREAAEVERDLADLNVEAVAEAAYQLGESCRVRGQLDRATAHYRRAAGLGRDPQPGASLLQLARGDADGACASITAAVVAAPSPFLRARLLRAQVQVALASDHPATAAGAADALEGLADRYPTPGFTAWAEEGRGAVLLAQDRPAEAAPLLSSAAARLTRLGLRYDAARASLLLADVLAATGDDDAARLLRRSAADDLDALGVPVPSTGGPASLPGGLTAREAEVLARVATGATNREVAASLTISEATVRRHLANVYVKLGVSSRTAAAAWAHEHHLDVPLQR